MENITSNMARAALQAGVLHQQGCLGHHAGPGPALLDPGGAAALAPSTPLAQDGRRGLRWCVPVGLSQLWLLRAWPAPPELGRVVGWRALLLGGVLRCSWGPAARQPLGSSPNREQALRAAGAGTCQLVESSSAGS